MASLLASLPTFDDTSTASGDATFSVTRSTTSSAGRRTTSKLSVASLEVVLRTELQAVPRRALEVHSPDTMDVPAKVAEKLTPIPSRRRSQKCR